MSNKAHFAFTGRFPVFRNRIVSPLYVSSPDAGSPVGVKVKAVWDTGASCSIVTRRVAEMLRLPQRGGATLRGPLGSSGNVARSSARVMVALGSNSIPLDVVIADMAHSDIDCDVLLGLDFITLGDFTITHDGELLAMSFTYPPADIPVDYCNIIPGIIPGTVTETVDDLDSDGNERHRRRLMLGDYFSRGKR